MAATAIWWADRRRVLRAAESTTRCAIGQPARTRGRVGRTGAEHPRTGSASCGVSRSREGHLGDEEPKGKGRGLVDIVGRSGERLSAYQAVVCLVCLLIGCISVKIVHDANEVFEQKRKNIQ